MGLKIKHWLSTDCQTSENVGQKIEVNDWIESYKNQLFAMKEELIENNVNSRLLDTIFFGGGTPSLMPLEIVESIIDLSKEIFGFKKDIEITLEANPSSYESKKFKELKN